MTLNAIHVRRLLPADAEQFQALRLQAPAMFASSFDEEKDTPLAALSHHLGKTDRSVFAAFVPERADPVGLVGLGREGLRSMAHKAFLWTLFVLPAFRKQGVARALIKEAQAFAAGLPVQQVTLSVNAANRAAVSLYESCGFTPFGLEPRAVFIDGRFHGDIHMVWFCDLAQSKSKAPSRAEATGGR